MKNKPKNQGIKSTGFPSLFYNFATSAVVLSLIGPVLFREKILKKPINGLNQRMGAYTTEELADFHKGNPRIWIHAVSVGEVGAAMPIIKALYEILPDCSILVSSSTFHGLNQAKKKAGGRFPAVYPPIDFIGSVKKALRRTRPHALVLLETEIWPNWISAAHNMGIKTIMANGRISRRSVKSYMRLRPFFRPVLQKIDLFSMTGKGDARRISMMGARPDRLVVNGNAKFDQIKTEPELKAEISALLPGLATPVFVAGSTRSGEEEIILEVFKAIRNVFREAVLILAPRHVERAENIKKLILKKNLTCQTLSHVHDNKKPLAAPVLLVDKMGFLFELYSLAHVVFCGGSLVPLGGQNVLEPTAWGKPVLFGPHMDDFKEAKELLLNTRGAVEVKDGYDLTQKALWLFNNPEKAKLMGQKGKKALMAHKGAAKKHALAIAGVLGMG